MMVSMVRSTACTCCKPVPDGTVTQAAAYTTFNEHDHVNVNKQFKITRMF